MIQNHNRRASGHNRNVLPAVGTQTQSALTTTFEENLTDARAIDIDRERRADRQINLINLNFQLGAAAVQLVLRETGRQNAVDRAARKTCEKVAAVRRRTRIRASGRSC